MSNTLHPISIWMILRWRKTIGIYVKWRNCLRMEEMERQSPTTNYSLLKYIMLFKRSTSNKALSFDSWIGMVSEIWKWARNSSLDRSPTERSVLEHPTLAFSYSPCWGILLVEVIPPLSIRSDGSGPCWNMPGSM